jgi:predicted RNA-binding Zn-ribbon protein involved in translation (DUF1610 family)
MTTIRTTCPRCGEVDMGPESILLQVVRGGREGTYRFECPTCMEPVEKRADRKIVALLVSAGVDVAGRAVPFMTAELLEEPGLDAEVEDPRGPLPPGAAFTIDDVIDFHFRLEDERYIRDFLASH